MSSVLRRVAEPVRVHMKFCHIESPCYNDTILNKDILFPFTITNGILDIAYIDNFKVDMVDSTGNAPNIDPDGAVRIMGGTIPIIGLGDNFKSYITAWRNPDVDTPISIYIPGVVQKVQIIPDNFLGAGTYEISTQPPSGDNYVVGGPLNSYRTVYVFKQPLTFTTVESGVTQYITFTTRFHED